MINRVWRSAAERSPRIKMIVGLGREFEDQASNTPAQFVRLSASVHEYFDYLIVHINLDTTQMIVSLREMGGAHVAFTDTFGFQASCIQAFINSITASLLGHIRGGLR